VNRIPKPHSKDVVTAAVLVGEGFLRLAMQKMTVRRWAGAERKTILLKEICQAPKRECRLPWGMDGCRKDVMAICWVREQMSLYWLG
jgi:hypothetical protein